MARKPRFSWRSNDYSTRTHLGYDGWDVAQIVLVDGKWSGMLMLDGAPKALRETLDGVDLPTGHIYPEEARKAVVERLRPYLAGKTFDQ